ncbi:hypothetical protein GLOTRDRAFT_126100 [Gloeophyllum trabeum ATCC 11539]|uniref:Uncharacterized protein n=1 Tax=Gloeophyllum trabeum (strain ATCC 11539 / FP-39264 / Madison 617) TaxID=670483 RepID=S7QKM9_GLOTA|nr:uncharacterized protein GLOTRDRAFT_126100 [Gloeophyllum trabeum ATCC 11539]EPQ59803.1 hypothetical protein GLOTRDRAFT_126100 [Gloeophyllum trabeum ATCC 11539]
MPLLKKIFHRKTRSESGIDINWPRTGPTQPLEARHTGTENGKYCYCCSPFCATCAARIDALASADPALPATELDIPRIVERITRLETALVRCKRVEEALHDVPSVALSKIQVLQGQLRGRQESLNVLLGNVASSDPVLRDIVAAVSCGESPEQALLAHIKRETQDPSSPLCSVLKAPPVLGVRLPVHLKSHVVIWLGTKRRQQSQRSKSVYWKTEVRNVCADILTPSASAVSSITASGTLTATREDALNVLIERHRRLKSTISTGRAFVTVDLPSDLSSALAAPMVHGPEDVELAPGASSRSLNSALEQQYPASLEFANGSSSVYSCSSLPDSVYTGICRSQEVAEPSLMVAYNSQDVFLSIPLSSSGSARSLSSVPRPSGSRRSLLMAVNVKLGPIAEAEENDVVPNAREVDAADAQDENVEAEEVVQSFSMDQPMDSLILEECVDSVPDAVVQGFPSSPQSILLSPVDASSLNISPLQLCSTPRTRQTGLRCPSPRLSPIFKLLPKQPDDLFGPSSPTLSPGSPSRQPSPSRLPVLKSRMSACEMRV